MSGYELANVIANSREGPLIVLDAKFRPVDDNKKKRIALRRLIKKITDFDIPVTEEFFKKATAFGDIKEDKKYFGTKPRILDLDIVKNLYKEAYSVKNLNESLSKNIKEPKALLIDETVEESDSGTEEEVVKKEVAKKVKEVEEKEESDSGTSDSGTSDSGTSDSGTEESVSGKVVEKKKPQPQPSYDELAEELVEDVGLDEKQLNRKKQEVLLKSGINVNSENLKRLTEALIKKVDDRKNSGADDNETVFEQAPDFQEVPEQPVIIQGNNEELEKALLKNSAERVLENIDKIKGSYEMTPVRTRRPGEKKVSFDPKVVATGLPSTVEYESEINRKAHEDLIVNLSEEDARPIQPSSTFEDDVNTVFGPVQVQTNITNNDITDTFGQVQTNITNNDITDTFGQVSTGVTNDDITNTFGQVSTGVTNNDISNTFGPVSTGNTPTSSSSPTTTDNQSMDTTSSGGLRSKFKEYKYHKHSLLLFFGSYTNPNWDKTLEKTVNDMEIDNETIISMMDMVINANGDKFLVKKRESSTKDELMVLLQLHFTIERNLHVGSRVPTASVPIGQLMKFRNAIDSSGAQQQSVSGAQQQPAQPQPTQPQSYSEAEQEKISSLWYNRKHRVNEGANLDPKTNPVLKEAYISAFEHPEHGSVAYKPVPIEYQTKSSIRTKTKCKKYNK